MTASPPLRGGPERRLDPSVADGLRTKRRCARILRLVPVLREFKLVAYFGEYHARGAAIAASRRKMSIFMAAGTAARVRPLASQ